MNNEIIVAFDCKENFWYIKILFACCSDIVKSNTIRIFLRSLVRGGEGIVTVEIFIKLLETLIKRGDISVASTDCVSRSTMLDYPVVRVADEERDFFLEFIKRVEI